MLFSVDGEGPVVTWKAAIQTCRQRVPLATSNVPGCSGPALRFAA